MSEPHGFDDFERKRRLFLTEWEVGVLPQDHEARLALETGVQFAKLVLQTGLTLNGGAFVLIPAYVALTPGRGEQINLVAILVWFGLGLAAMFLASVIAFFTMQLQQSGIRERREASAKHLHELFDNLVGSSHAEDSSSAEDHEANSKKYWKWGTGLQHTAVALAVASFALFITGGWFAASTVAAP
ncbi:hypothetical protein [Parvibaculum sp.]|uniref:hypothetical protein n=1 Tax=Parvibaculum sp. TaxID=2024848 RepID=UPI003BA9C403